MSLREMIFSVPGMTSAPTCGLLIVASADAMEVARLAPLLQVHPEQARGVLSQAIGDSCNVDTRILAECSLHSFYF